MITGAHTILYSARPEADREFLRDVLKLPHVDVGGGWLIFGLPPSEVAVHPSEENDVHEFYLIADDLGAFLEEMARRRITCEPAQDMGWGILTRVRLPGGGKLGVYQPRHGRPPSVTARPRRRRTVATAVSAAKGTRPRKAPSAGRGAKVRSRRR
jgi:hypothetical protein